MRRVPQRPFPLNHSILFVFVFLNNLDTFLMSSGHFPPIPKIERHPFFNFWYFETALLFKLCTLHNHCNAVSGSMGNLQPKCKKRPVTHLHSVNQCHIHDDHRSHDLYHHRNPVAVSITVFWHRLVIFNIELSYSISFLIVIILFWLDWPHVCLHWRQTEGHVCSYQRLTARPSNSESGFGFYGEKNPKW